jgi:hypothetical protein
VTSVAARYRPSLPIYLRKLIDPMNDMKVLKFHKKWFQGYLSSALASPESTSHLTMICPERPPFLEVRTEIEDLSISLSVFHGIIMNVRKIADLNTFSSLYKLVYVY